MTTEIGPEDLEQRCVFPGRWQVEGWTVTRQVGGRRWVIECEPPVTARTLAEARLLICDAINQRRSPAEVAS